MKGATVAKKLAMWQYVTLGIERGPISEVEFKQLVLDGKVKAKTDVRSPERTQDRWIKAGTHPAIVKLIERRMQAEQKRKLDTSRAKADATRKREASQIRLKEATELQRREAELFREQAALVQAQNEQEQLRLQGIDYAAPPKQIPRPRGEMAGIQVRRTIAPVLFDCAVSAILAVLLLFTVFLIPVSIILVVRAAVRLARYHAVEVEITNRAVKLSVGVLSKQTKEIRLRKIESVYTRQTLFGRIFGFADIAVQGTGGGTAWINYVKDADSVKRDLDDLIEYNAAGGGY
jgi:membrane protein YdbS with pleckstrin-like domain